MKNIIFVLATMPMICSAQAIKRTGSIQIPQFGLITIEVEALSQASGNEIKYSTETLSVDEFNENYGKTECYNSLSAKTPKMIKFTIKNQSGKILAVSNVEAEISQSKKSVVDSESACKNQIPKSGQLSVGAKSNSAEFTVINNLNKKVKISLSTYISGKMTYNNNYYDFKLDSSSLKNATVYTDSESSTQAVLVDPSLPVEAGDAYCTAHPYDCR